MNNELTSPELTGTGYIIVNVTTANQAIPIDGASVYVYEYLPQQSEGNPGELITVETTNASGATKRIALPAPDRSISLSPGIKKAYQTYNIDVQKDGYYNQSYINVPVFDSITAIQNVDLIPLSANGRTDGIRNDGIIYYESENPSL